MNLITDSGEFNILNVRVIDTEMKTIYIEEKQKGFVVLVSNKILDQKSDMKLLEEFKLILEDEVYYLELVGFSVKLKVQSITRLNIGSKLMYLEEIKDNEYRLTFSSALIKDIFKSDILIKF